MFVINMFLKMTLCGQVQWDILTTRLYPTKPNAHLQFSTFLIILPVSALRIWGRKKKTTSVTRNISTSEDISLPTKMPPWTGSSVLPKTKSHTDVWLSLKMFIKASYYNSEFRYRFKIPNRRGKGIGWIIWILAPREVLLYLLWIQSFAQFVFILMQIGLIAYKPYEKA